MIKNATGAPYIEPIGNFQGTPQEWHDYYLLAISIGCAIIFSRVVASIYWQDHLRISKKYEYTVGISKPRWFLITISIIFYYWINSVFGFFVTGVNSTVSLPLGLNAPFAFMSLIGVAIALSFYVNQDVKAKGKLESWLIATIFLITAIASISMASRAAIIMQSLPIVISAFYIVREKQRIPVFKLLFLFTLFLISVLSIVSYYRSLVFSGEGNFNPDLFWLYQLESFFLITDRWVGAEALMVSVAEKKASIGLFFDLLAENPSAGVNSIYQQLSGGFYEFNDKMVFLTLPGYFGIVGLSGDTIFIFLITFLMCSFGLMFEKVLNFILFYQVVPVALLCAALANSLTQISFPLLVLPFIAQMTILTLILGLIIRKQVSKGILKKRNIKGRVT